MLTAPTTAGTDVCDDGSVAWHEHAAGGQMDQIGIEVDDRSTAWVRASPARGGRFVMRGGTLPSVVAVGTSGLLVAGSAATAPDARHVTTGFVGDLGAAAPAMIGGTPYGVEALVAQLVALALHAARQSGDVSPVIGLAHADGLDEYRTGLWVEAARLVGVPPRDVELVPRAEALAAVDAAGLDVAPELRVAAGAALVAERRRATAAGDEPDGSAAGTAGTAAAAAGAVGAAGTVLGSHLGSDAAAGAAPGYAGTPLAAPTPGYAGTPLSPPPGYAGTPLNPPPGGYAGTPLNPPPGGYAGTPLPSPTDLGGGLGAGPAPAPAPGGGLAGGGGDLDDLHDLGDGRGGGDGGEGGGGGGGDDPPLESDTEFDTAGDDGSGGFVVIDGDRRRRRRLSIVLVGILAAIALAGTALAISVSGDSTATTAGTTVPRATTPPATTTALPATVPDTVGVTVPVTLPITVAITVPTLPVTTLPAFLDVAYSGATVTSELNNKGFTFDGKDVVLIQCTPRQCFYKPPVFPDAPLQALPLVKGTWHFTHTTDLGPVCVVGGNAAGELLQTETYDLRPVGHVVINGITFPASVVGTYTTDIPAVPSCTQEQSGTADINAVPDVP